MNVMRNIIVFSAIFLTTIILVVLGFIYAKTEEEKINWLAPIYDVSHQGDLAFVKYNEGKPEIYLKSDDSTRLVLQLSDTMEILDITFVPNNDNGDIIFSVTEGNHKELSSVVYLLDGDTAQTSILFEKDALITEITFDPKNEHKLYYLQANKFESYSPIAQAHPHEFDIYDFNVETEEHVQHTTLNKYSMSSLQVSDTKDAVYVQMDDDVDAHTAEEIFDVKERIFEIPLNDEKEMSVLTDPSRTIPVYDFAILPDDDAIVFQSISNFAAGDTYEYELYYYNWKNHDEKRLTHLASYASRPVVSESEDKIYFMIDEHFGKSNVPKRKIYSMDMNGANMEEVNIQVNNE